MSSPVVLITGALTGTLAFAHDGARVVVSGRHDDEGQKLASELRNLGTEAEFVRTDVRHEEEVKSLVDKTIARFGRLDIAVNNAGTYGKVGGPTAAVYVGSKHAVEGITKSAALELAGTGIRVNIVGPGPTETGMFNRFAQTQENKANFLEAHIPTKRMGLPEEIANAIVFIASDKASYIVGASLAVDGGMLAG